MFIFRKNSASSQKNLDYTSAEQCEADSRWDEERTTVRQSKYEMSCQ